MCSQGSSRNGGVTRLTFEYDSEPFGKERDAAIMKMAKEAGVEVVTENSHTLYDLDRIIDLNGQKPPLTYKRFQAIISRMGRRCDQPADGRAVEPRSGRTTMTPMACLPWRNCGSPRKDLAQLSGKEERQKLWPAWISIWNGRPGLPTMRDLGLMPILCWPAPQTSAPTCASDASPATSSTIACGTCIRR
ncbi:Cryptochrome-2 [Microtus ochrogaster]|uniref:Cryptochrome-2 n=1 Tax=Microtus ochrogaster TaxID=79684 RepID=A0A8J6L5G0_MICOH|nr:Cryptochrome-2 [Microtus ochrogaster]